MRRFLLPFAVCLLAAGCAAPERPLLQPAEVLQRSVLASNTLDSFAYFLTLDATSARGSASLTGSLRVNGVLRRERTVATGTGWLAMTRAYPSGERTEVRVDGAYGLVPQQRPVVRVDGVTTASGDVLFEHAAGDRWISLPVDDEPSPMQSASQVDQRWIALQTSALSVTKDLGMAALGGTQTYHYAVTLNVDALRSVAGRDDVSGLGEALRDKLSGEVWIDADTFLLRRASWNLQDLHDGPQTLGMRLTVSLSDFNHAENAVEPPMPNQIAYPDDAIFATVFSGALVPFLTW